MTLEARNITVRINGSTLLDNVSNIVHPGEVLAILGANGAGKTTLVKTLAGDIKPDSGQILMGDRPLDQWPRRAQAQVRAILPQSSTLNFPFTVLEVVLMGRTPHLRGIEQAEDYQIARDALELTETLELQNRAYTTLSGGERQRVQLSRVLAQIWTSPEKSNRYLLMDEPLNNLDLAHQHDTLRIAHSFAEQGVVVVIVLHDLNLAAQYADRVIILKRGKLLAMGAPCDVLTSETIRAAFDIEVGVIDHPYMDCPLIVPVPITVAER